MKIQSHTKPYKSLNQHVYEVFNIFNAILKHHSDSIRGLIIDYKDYVIKFHDLGKAIPEFQKYISNPKQYRDNPQKKAHAPISLLLWIVFAIDNKISKDITLIVASIVWKHHSDFPVFNGSDGLREAFSFYDFSETFDILQYPFDSIKNELKIVLKTKFEPDDIDIEDIFEHNYLDQLTIEKASEYKIKALLLFSILLESDRAYLALEKNFLKNKYFNTKKTNIDSGIVNEYLVEKSKQGNQNKDLNKQRTKIRQQIISNISKHAIESVTLPTGIGKTMIAAQWALKNLEASKIKKKVIIVLPFLSIIDQTVKEYQKLLSDSDTLILEAHSIAERKYMNNDTEDSNSEESNKYNNAVDFLSDTWSKDFIITTFDQFIMSLLSSKGSHLIRFHNIADSLIIMDEIQAIPTQLWQPLSLALTTICNLLNTKVLIMSATQPEFINSYELVVKPETIFNQQTRYKIILNYQNAISIDNFISQCIERIQTENWNLKRVLIVLNTRASARLVIDSLEEYINTDIYLLSADVTPKERLASIQEIKKNKPCLVISTQCIEAGVDIDMDFIIRDFAPLDSIIQCAGRCNRNRLKNRSLVELVSLLNNNGKCYSSDVYDSVLLEKTRVILSNENEYILEEDIYKVVSLYFKILKSSKDTGQIHAENWVYWRK